MTPDVEAVHAQLHTLIDDVRHDLTERFHRGESVADVIILFHLLMRLVWQSELVQLVEFIDPTGRGFAGLCARVDELRREVDKAVPDRFSTREPLL